MMTILASVMLALTATARNDWYDTPITIEPGEITLDTIPASPDDIMVHLRMAGVNKHSARWSLIWQNIDDADRITATVTMPQRKTHDEIYPAVATVDVTQRVDSADILITSSNFTIQDEFFSLKIVYDGFSTRLFAGDREKTMLAELPVDLSRPSAVSLASTSPLWARRISVMHNSGDTPSRAQCPDTEDLTQMLAHAAGIEGVWRYLDRDIDTKRASLDQKYRLAIVKADDGVLQIVSLDPASEAQGAIKPLQVKGWLRPTRFQNNYDMIWYDAKGHELDDDNNAQLSDDGSILTLRFPVYKSQLRFFRYSD